MKVNIDKTKVMAVTRKEKSLDIIISNKFLMQVNSFKCLDTRISGGKRIDKEINKRIDSCGRFCVALNRVYWKEENKSEGKGI